MKHTINMGLILLAVVSGCRKSSQTAMTTYGVGFKTIHITDKTRKYKPDVDSTRNLHYRPIDIDVWYPVDGSQVGSKMVFGNYLSLFEERINLYTDSDAGDGFGMKFAQMLAEGFQCADSTRIMNFPTSAYSNTREISKEFPVVIYMASYNGMGQENYMMFEQLAQKGYVVLSVNSIGRFPGDMTMKKEDTEEQVNDAVASVKYLSENNILSFDNVALVGYSWGGLAGLLAAPQISNIRCFVSLDGSEIHHYGFNKEEDADFDRIINSTVFQKLTMDYPYLRLESSLTDTKPSEDSVNNLTEKLGNKYTIIKVDSASHADFAVYPYLVKSAGNCPTSGLYITVSQLTIAFLDEHLSGKQNFETTLQSSPVSIVKNR